MNSAAETVIIGGKIGKKKLGIALFGGFLFLAALIGTFGITGVAYALPLSGVGEFTVKFDKLVGHNFKLYGGLADSASSKGTNPVAVNDIESATIDGLEISKEVKLPTGGGFKVVISAASTVDIKGLIQKATLINGDAEFSDLTMQENYVGDIKDPLEKVAKEFTQSANTVTIKNGDLKTLYLFQKQVSLPGMKVSFESLDSGK